VNPAGQGGPKTRILFVCIGNSCRSQMAEAFARAYGNDVLIAASAGLHPAFSVATDTLHAMAARNLDLRDHFPKSIRHLGRAQFDIVVNLSGRPLPDMPFPGNAAPSVREWDVLDPIGVSYEEHCEIRDQIEKLVMNLVLELRRDRPETGMRGLGSRFSQGIPES
jgi:arsenate reductase